MNSFASLSTFSIAGRGQVFTVANPQVCLGFAHLLGPALIDGVERNVVGVECFAKAGLHGKGEPIGLLVEVSAQ